MLQAFYPGGGVILNGDFISLAPPQRQAGVRQLTAKLLALRPHPAAMYVAIKTQLPTLESFVPPAILADECQGMTTEQLKAIAADPLFTIGGHTVDHPYLTKCGRQEAQRQIADNKAWIEEITAEKCRFFAYPLGDYDDSIREHCVRLGFEHAFATESAANRQDPYSIRRIGVYSPSLLPLRIKLCFGHWLPMMFLQKVRTLVFNDSALAAHPIERVSSPGARS
jgi:hypothetical protein